jgi:hypothetical protein
MVEDVDEGREQVLKLGVRRLAGHVLPTPPAILSA